MVVLKGYDMTSHVPLSMLATICPHHVDATKGSINGNNVLFKVSEGLEIHVVAPSPLARDVQVGASVNADKGFLGHSTAIEIIDTAFADACFDLTANTFIWDVQAKPLQAIVLPLKVYDGFGITRQLWSLFAIGQEQGQVGNVS